MRPQHVRDEGGLPDEFRLHEYGVRAQELHVRRGVLGFLRQWFLLRRRGKVHASPAVIRLAGQFNNRGTCRAPWRNT